MQSNLNENVTASIHELKAQDVVNELIQVSLKAERIRVLFNLILENLNLNPRSSRKEFFDAMYDLYEKEQSAQQQLGAIQAREALKVKKKTAKKDNAVS